MRRRYVSIFSTIVAMALLAPEAIAQEPEPISFLVVDNNRMFKPKEATRFEQDLHVYLRCADADGAKYPKCKKYRDDGTIDGRLVPNLRTGDSLSEYLTRYDKSAMAYDRGYASETSRTLRFSLRDDLLKAAIEARPNCSWTLNESSGKKLAGSAPDCRSQDFKIDLEFDVADQSMRFAGTIEVVVRSQDGAEAGRHSIPVSSRDYLIVALGDSFTSGEGNPERNVTHETPAQWLDYRCHRSVFSYPVILSQMLSLSDPRHSITLVHLACSGARSSIGATKPYGGLLTQKQMNSRWSAFDSWLYGKSKAFPQAWRKYGTAKLMLDPQVEQARQALAFADGAVRRPDLIVMSVGVNDMGEVPFIKAIAEDDFDAKKMAQTFARKSGLSRAECFFDDKEPLTTAEMKIDDAKRMKIGFDCLQERLQSLSGTLKSALSPRKVYLMEYHDPLQDEDGSTCGKPEHRALLDDFLGEAALYKRLLGPLLGKGELTKPELKYAHENFFKPFSQALELGANKSEWLYVRSRGDEHKRGFCSSKRSWYHDYRASRSRQAKLPDDDIVSTGTLHPNTFGQYYSAVRALNQIRQAKLFGNHNISCVEDDAFSAPKSKDGKKPYRNPDGTQGLAWYIWNKDDHAIEVLSKYHAYRKVGTPCSDRPG